MDFEFIPIDTTQDRDGERIRIAVLLVGEVASLLQGRERWGENILLHRVNEDMCSEVMPLIENVDMVLLVVDMQELLSATCVSEMIDIVQQQQKALITILSNDTGSSVNYGSMLRIEKQSLSMEEVIITPPPNNLKHQAA